MTEKIVVNDGIKVHYKIRKGQGSTLVFLHGGGGSLSAWDIILPFFEKRNFNLITCDLRGHGLSDRPEKITDYILEKHADDVNKLLEKEKIKKVVVIGHCLGSMVGATLAVQYPQKIEKLILINTGYKISWYLINFLTLPILLFTASVLSKLFKPKKGKNRVNYFQYQNTSDLSPGRILADLKVLGSGAAVRQLLAFWRWNGEKYFAMIKCPTLVIAGSNDLIYPEAHTKEVVSLFKNCRCQIEYINTNHIAPINSPKIVYDKIIGFI